MRCVWQSVNRCNSVVGLGEHTRTGSNETIAYARGEKRGVEFPTSGSFGDDQMPLLEVERNLQKQ